MVRFGRTLSFLYGFQHVIEVQPEIPKHMPPCGLVSSWGEVSLGVLAWNLSLAKTQRTQRFLGTKLLKSFYKTRISYFFCPLAHLAPWR